MLKAVDFLYTNNELTEKEIKKTIPFTIDLKNYLEGKTSCLGVGTNGRKKV
jgi:hypothetical protein